MEKNILVNFPFPYKLNNEYCNGFDIKWPEFCVKCTHNSCTYEKSGFQVCPRGLSYYWYNEQLMIGGIIIKERASTASSISAALRRIGAKNEVSLRDIERALNNIFEIERGYEEMCKNSIERIKEEKSKEILKHKDMKIFIQQQVGEYLKSMHDVKQFISTVIQNVNCMVTKYGKSTDEDNINAASHHEKAIFYSCRMMEAKIQTISYVNSVNKISIDDFSNTEIHRLISKIVKIYQSSFDDKNIKIRISNSQFKVFTHFNAVSIIPHAIIDNALKYSPEGSHFEISFDEDDGFIVMIFESIGPKILPVEKYQIFNPNFRGKHAAKITDEGIGFGLYAAQLVAEKLGGKIEVVQNPNESWGFKGFYQTTFSVYLPK